MVDVARLGLAVDSSQVEKGTVSLHQLTGAAGQASVAAQKLAGASQVEAAGQKAATSATIAHTAALNAQHAVMRSTAQQRTMMVYQLNDIAVSLASGMNPAMVAMQQGSQILQGGLMPAIRTLVDLGKSLVVTFWPVAAVIGAVAAAMAGLTYEFNKTADVQVGFFDVAMAGWQLFAESVGSVLGPVFTWIVDRFKQLWDFIAPIMKNIANTLLGAFVGSYEAIIAVWSQLPAVLGDLVYQAAENTTNGVIYLIRSIQVEINDFLTDLDGMMAKFNSPVRFGTMQLMGYADLQNPYAGAAGGVADTASAAFAGGQKDYLGMVGDVWSKRAQEIAAARRETEELGGAAKAANDNFKALDDTSNSLADTWGGTLKSAWGGFWSDFHNGLKEGKGLWEALGNAGMNALDKLTSKALDMAANGIWDMILGAFGPTLGMGSWGIGSGMAGTSSITGSSGGFFPAFDGGGYTGAGARSGGMDGKGGFLAMMHPNETVIDHSRGQSGGGTSVVRIELGPDLEGRVLTQAAGQSVQIVRASQPDTVQKSTAASGQALASGDYKRGMATYGLSQQAKRR